MNTEYYPQVNALDKNISQAINNLANQLGLAVKEGRRTCVHCEHFIQGTEHCALAAVRPPAAVIAFGCPSFVDLIPF